MIQELLKDLPILDEGQLKGASKEQLSQVFNQINNLKGQLSEQALGARVQLETKQNEYDKLCKEVQNKFGTVAVDELNNLKENKISKLVELGQSLQALKTQGIVNG